MTKNPPLKIGLLLCDDVDADARAQYGTYTEMFKQGLDSSQSNIKLAPFRCFEGEALPEPEEFDGYIISGSRYSVYEDLPWINDLKPFIQQCWEKNIKVVGICFGHQLIAHALGGKTEKADVGWGFGIHSSKITKKQSWMGDPLTDETDQKESKLPADLYNLIVIHQDQVVDVPSQFETIAQNDFCPNSMIVAGDKMLGIQGHPEFSKEFCAFRAEFRRELIGEEVYQSTLHSLADNQLNSNVIMRWIKNFLSADTQHAT